MATLLDLEYLVASKVQPPALPYGPVNWTAQYQDQLNNVQRLFYNRLTQSYNNLISPPLPGVPPGASVLYFPYAAIQRTTDKTFTANTATEITFDQNDFLSACQNDGTNGIEVEVTGIYNYQFSVQWRNTDSQAHTAWIWLRVNSTDVAGTGSQFSIPSKHGTTDGHLIAAANFYVELTAGDFVKMFAAVDNTAVAMEAYAVQTSPFAMPAIPSCVATLSFVSAV
jgi:hypothetical protein